MILITGATGNVGSEVLRQLRTRNEPFRVLARDPSKLRHLGATAEVVRGDLDRRDSVRAALLGVEKVVLIAPGPDVSAQERTIIEEAERAGVTRLVQVSSLGVDGGYGGGPSHVPGEQLLHSSRLAWTILRPGGFMSNVLYGLEDGVYRDPTGNGKYPYIDPRDVGSVAVEVLASVGHERKTYGLTGGRAISAEDQVKVLARILKKPIRRIDVTLPGEPSSDPILHFYELVRAGRLEEVLPTVRQLLGREPRSFEEWARDHAARISGGAGTP